MEIGGWCCCTARVDCKVGLAGSEDWSTLRVSTHWDRSYSEDRKKL